MHISFNEISFVSFACGNTSTRSFDFEIDTKQGTQDTFSSIERDESMGGCLIFSRQKNSTSKTED